MITRSFSNFSEAIGSIGGSTGTEVKATTEARVRRTSVLWDPLENFMKSLSGAGSGTGQKRGSKGVTFVHCGPSWRTLNI